MCHMSGVTRQVSGVRCQVSGVMSNFLFFFLGQIGVASRWKVCYQQGLPRRVNITLAHFSFTTVTTTIYSLNTSQNRRQNLLKENNIKQQISHSGVDLYQPVLA